MYNMTYTHPFSIAIIIHVYPSLQVGGKLLPCLIQLYQWLHTHLSYLVTSERAYTKLKIGQVIKLAARKVDPSLYDLYKRVKGGWVESITTL